MEKSFQKQLRICRKGIISSWFFCLFLYCTAFIFMFADSEMRMMKTMNNLQTAQKYLNAETEVIMDIRNLLDCGVLDEGTYETMHYAYEISKGFDSVTAVIFDPYEELLIETDENRRIIDYETIRDTSAYDEVMH